MELKFEVIIHHSRAKGIILRDIEKLFFNIFISVYELEPVVFIVSDGSLIIDRIDNNEAATGFVILGTKPFLDEIHHLCTNVATCTLIKAVNTQSADKHRRVCTPSFGIGDTSLNTVSDIIRHPVCLYTVIGKCEGRKNYIGLVTVYPTICLPKKLSIIMYGIFIKELIQIRIPALELTAMAQYVMVQFNHHTVFFKAYAIHTYDFFCQGKTNSLERLKKSLSLCSSSDVRRGVVFLPFSSALISNSTADSPHNSGDVFIVVAILLTFLFYKVTTL